jgi:hypothetical protein
MSAPGRPESQYRRAAPEGCPARTELATLLDAELERAVPAPVTALAAELAARAGAATAAVLFYGSALRDAALDGVLDFYVLTDRPIVWPGSRWT